MQIRGQAQKVTIYIDESDRFERKPLYMAILETLKTENCAGATVTRGIAGFGAHSRIHTASLVALSADLPLIIEWVDNPARIERVIPKLQTMVTEGLITVQDVEVVVYSHRRLRQLPATIPVRDIMNREVHAARAETPLLDIIVMLLDKNYRALPIVDEAHHVIGIVTEANLLNKVGLLATSAQQQLTRAEMAIELQRLSRLDQTVAKAMTPNPITVSDDMTLLQAVGLMIEHDIKRLPVINAEKKLIGIVSRVDVLRTLCQPPLAETPRQNLPPGHHVKVGEIMTTNVPTVSYDAALVEIVELLVTSIQRRVIVIDQAQRVVGLITDGDLISQATATERSGIIHSLSQRLPLKEIDTFQLGQRTAAEVMTTPAITTTPQTSLHEVLQLLLTHRIKRLPVVDAEGKLVGLVDRGGILQAIAQGEVVETQRRT